MAELSATLIDVGWGDSIFIKSQGDKGGPRFALIDCNDYENERSSLIFVKRWFHRNHVDFESIEHNFEWALLTHGHADHARGLKRMLKTFGTRNLWYPKSVESTTYGNLLNYANRSSRVDHHEAVNHTKTLAADFGDVALEVLWPNNNQIDQTNENNNSVVLALTLATVTFVLTGDSEAPNWATISQRLPSTVRVFQAPHHGARNGMFDGQTTPWLDRLQQLPHPVAVAMSSHTRPHGHPHPDVIQEITQRNLPRFRTDEDYHLTFSTHGTDLTVKYSHV